jgi:hypothetical protein
MGRKFRALISVAAVCVAFAACSDDGPDAQATASPSADATFRPRVAASDLAQLDLPLYPNTNPGDTTVIHGPIGPGYSITVQMTTLEPFDDVRAWYQSHLEIEFVGARFGSPAAGQSAIFSDSEPDDGTPVLTRKATIETAKDAGGKTMVVITLHTTSAKKDIPKPDSRG